jgi:hypothetical protein
MPAPVRNLSLIATTLYERSMRSDRDPILEEGNHGENVKDA